MFDIKSVIVIFYFIYSVASKSCMNLDVSLIQKIDNEGFHREFRWLVETTSPSKAEWIESNCKLALRLQITPGMFVNPDQVADLSRTQNLSVYIEGKVDVEIAAHEATEHTVYIFLGNENFEKNSLSLPVHLRYQRAQITGGFGKVSFNKPSLLALCPTLLDICGRGLKVEAPCDKTGEKVCIWKNVTYQALFDDVELFVPIGDLDDYPLVSIVTLLLGCGGCIYILSVLSMSPL